MTKSNSQTHLNTRSEERLQSFAQLRNRPARTLLEEAVEQYLDREERRAAFLADGVEAWGRYVSTGLHLTADEADAWLAELEGGKDVDPPKCHA